MNKFLAVLALATLALCEPPNNQYGPPQGGGYNNNNNQNYNAGAQLYNSNNNVPIVRQENVNNGEGGYQYSYETGDGTSAQEQGYLKDADSPSAQGSYAYTGTDGVQYSITYTADENGFLPQGAHIPTAPPIPEEILKALEQNRDDEARGIVDDGQYRPDPSEGYGGRQHQQQQQQQQQGY